MISERNFVKVLCALTFLGLTTAAKAKEISGRRVNITAFQGDLWFDEWCDEFEDFQMFPHPLRCESYLICYDGIIYEDDCPADEIFDYFDWTCMHWEDAVCNIEPQPDHDPECPPPGSDEVVFLPSEYCELFYICINGHPVQLNCRPGQHWNIEKEFCDNPETAGCEDDKTSPPNQLPDCPVGIVGQFPHPSNCNWFIHCDNGNRSIQQCRHLHHFDMDLRTCLFHSTARCIKQARLR